MHMVQHGGSIYFDGEEVISKTLNTGSGEITYTTNKTGTLEIRAFSDKYASR